MQEFNSSYSQICLSSRFGADSASAGPKQICSGRGGGAGCQSRARSTICRIRANHQLARVNRRCRRFIVWHPRTVPKPNSNCPLIIICLSFAGSLNGLVGQRLSNQKIFLDFFFGGGGG